MKNLITACVATIAIIAYSVNGYGQIGPPGGGGSISICFKVVANARSCMLCGETPCKGGACTWSPWYDKYYCNDTSGNIRTSTATVAGCEQASGSSSGCTTAGQENNTVGCVFAETCPAVCVNTTPGSGNNNGYQCAGGTTGSMICGITPATSGPEHCRPH